MAVDGFMQGVVTQEALCVADGAAVIAALLEQQDQPLQRVEEALRQPGTFEQQPVVVAARQEVAAVRRDGAFQRGHARASLAARGLGQRGLELGDVQSERCIPAPAHGLIGDFQVRLGLGQTATQRVEELPQVGVRLCVGGVGPEEKGELLARLRGVAMQEQIREQRLQARGMHPHQLRIVKREAETAKQPNMQCLHHPQQHVLVASSLPVCPCFRGDFCSNATS